MELEEIIEALKNHCNEHSCCDDCIFSLEISNFKPYYICMVDKIERNYEREIVEPNK